MFLIRRWSTKDDGWLVIDDTNTLEEAYKRVAHQQQKYPHDWFVIDEEYGQWIEIPRLCKKPKCRRKR